MRLHPQLVEFIAESVIDSLFREKKISFDDNRMLATMIENIIEQEMEQEAELDEEVRSILSQYYQEMRNSGVSYDEMFRKIKTRLARDKGVTTSQGDRTTKLADDRINQLSHRITEDFANDTRVEFKDVFNNIRLAIRRAITIALQKEAELERNIRAKISNLSKNVEEATAEWEALYRNYYDDGISRLKSIK